jgi:3-hydroxyacyl-CoA dehydrogenase
MMDNSVEDKIATSEINAVISLELDREIALISVNSPPVNALSADVRRGLCEAFDRAAASDAAAIVLICDGRTFIAGADIMEFGAEMRRPSIVDLQERMDASSKPIVAAIHGTALGGGLEVALCAHYRVAVPTAKLGLPEVALGLLPGAGGTQRLPRIVGVATALDMITLGKPVSAKAAAEMGLVDEIVAEGALRDGAIAFARQVVAEGRCLVRVRDMDARLDEARANPGLFEDFRKANARRFRGFLAPGHIIDCVKAAVDGPSFEQGMATERVLFQELMDSPQSAAQRYYFFAERQAAKIPDVSADTPVRPVASVGILGAGMMGGGIAMNFLNIGIPVTIVELKQEALDRGFAAIRKNYERSAKRTGETLEQIDRRMQLLSGSLSMEGFADCDLVIEAVFERMDIKKDVFTRLDRICKPGAILATNTSALDVDEIAAVTARPEDVIGLHFFSPANVMKLLEVVRGDRTAKDVIATAMKLAKKIGKIAVLAGVCPGFIGNRMLKFRQEQAHQIVREGAMPWDVDRVLVEFGFPMGPFSMADLAGLDLGWVRENSRGETVRDILCEMDRRGQKTGAGYYDYDENRQARPSPVTEQVIRDFVARSGGTARAVSDEDILARLVHPMINEGAKILEEGKAVRASDIDVVWVNGYGWPVYRGGPMYYADQIGLAKIVATMRDIAAQDPECRISPLLERLATSGSTFAGAVGGADA